MTIRSRRLGAIACLVALCGIIFGVGGALAQPRAGRPARAARLAHLRAHAKPHAARTHRLRMDVRAARPRRARGHRARHKHGRMHRMVARAHHARRAHAGVRARHAARAAQARRRAARRHRHHKKAGKNTHRLTMRSFVATLRPATAAIAGQSLPGSLIDVGSGAIASAPTVRATSAPAAATSGSSQLSVLASRVRSVAIAASVGTTARTAGRTTGTSGTSTAAATAQPQSPAKHAPARTRPKPHSSGTSFLIPLGVPAPIEHFVNRVPEALWIALASALALAGVGGAAALGSARRIRRQAGEYAAVAAVALTDPLTGVLNRRGFSDVAERELARARRYRTPFVLAYVDVRGLKSVNDSEGHLAGDAVIRQAARLLSDSVRAEDAVGRLGGDELALLLTGQSATGADAVIERIEARLPAVRDELGLDTSWDLTIGTASFPADGATFEELVATADRRLYEQRGIQLR